MRNKMILSISLYTKCRLKADILSTGISIILFSQKV